jgi:hypothetical protein
MKNLCLVAGLLVAACGGSSKPSSTSPSTVAAETGGDGQPEVDPTVPSWAPRTCIAYHRAVVQAVDCVAVEQGKRDTIKAKYATDSESWKTADANPAKIEEVKAYCESQTASVRAEIGTLCVK